MTVSDCITAYHALSAEIFDEPWRPKAWKVSKALFGLTGSTDEARSKRLRAVVCKIIEEHLPADERTHWTQQGGQFDPEKVPLKPSSHVVTRDCLTSVATRVVVGAFAALTDNSEGSSWLRNRQTVQKSCSGPTLIRPNSITTLVLSKPVWPHRLHP